MDKSPTKFTFPCSRCGFLITREDGQEKPHACGDLMLRRGGVHDNERGTRHFFGRRYHWAWSVPGNCLTLLHGPDPVEFTLR